MVWTVPQTAVIGEVVRAAFWNTNVRDNFRVFNIANIQSEQILIGVGPGELELVDADTQAIQTGLTSEYPETTVPTGYLQCDGSMVSKATYPSLFALIGTTFGADTATMFTLPDLPSRVSLTIWIIKT